MMYANPHQFTAQLLHAWNIHDIEQIVSFYAPECEGLDVGQAEPPNGRDGIKRLAVTYLTAFPDLHVTVEETICDANRISLTWTARGVHRGALMHIPPTGKAVVVRGVTLLTLHNNQIARLTNIWDVAGLLRHIGLLPEL
jgi:steroid delta-isomerase-like uncharacterized protein